MRAGSTGWRAVASAIAILAATTLSACTAGSTDAGAGKDSTSLPKVRVAVGIDGSYAPFFLAAEKGLFKKHGVDVEVVQFGRGGEAVEAIATGQIQMAGSSEVTTIGQLQQNPDLRAMLVYEQSGQYLKVVTGKNITNPSQIKKMGIVPGLSELSAIKFLQSKNIDPATVKFVSAGPPEIPALLQKGDIDAYVLWEPWPSKGAELGGKILESTGDYNWSYVHWLIAANKWLNANTGVAGKVAAALDEAAKLTESDSQAAAQATEKATKIPPAQTVAAVKEIDFKVRDITQTDLAGYDLVADFYVNTGKLKAKPDVPAAVLLNWFSANASKG
jgi:ABC-type nitrate/sulfonate/bicarbonate transport system substrate-binding protein